MVFIKLENDDLDFFKKLIIENDECPDLIICYFTATWCGPCKNITPYFHELNEKYKNVLFLKVDVDENEETTQECDINSMPTFQFYKSQNKVGQFSGADKNKLLNLIQTNN